MQNHFTETIFYQIELTAKYCKLLGSQVFEKFNAGITCEEYSVLDVLLSSPELCQRDLAKLILKIELTLANCSIHLRKKDLLKENYL